MRLLDLLVRRELANSEAELDKMTTLEGLPAIGLDGLASSACGPEAALAILAPLGALGANWLAPITLAILLVLAMLFGSNLAVVIVPWSLEDPQPSNVPDSPPEPKYRAS